MLFRNIFSKGISALVLLSLILPACNSARQPVTTPTPTPPPTNQYEIRAQDSGKTFTYSVTTRFSVILDQNQYPKSDLACQP